MRNAVLLALVASGAVACCAYFPRTNGLTETEIARLRNVPVLPLVVQISTADGPHTNAGSAFPVRPRVFRTAKHVLPPTVTKVTLGTELVDIEPVAWGESDRLDDDWIEFAVMSPSRCAQPLPKPTRRPSRRSSPGTAVRDF